MKNDSTDRRSVDQLSHMVVSDWEKETGISLSKKEKSRLESMITQSVPAFVEANPNAALQQFAEKIRQEEQQSYMEVLEGLDDDSFPGFISKQRLLNILEYGVPDSEGRTDD